VVPAARFDGVAVTTMKGLWYRGDEAARRAGRADHRVRDRYEGAYLERT
jgi:hypothetical protein